MITGFSFCSFAAYSVTAWDGISDSKGHAFPRSLLRSLLRFGGKSARLGSDLGELNSLVYWKVLFLSNVTVLGLSALLVL